MENAVFCLSLDTELYWGMFPRMSLEEFNQTYHGTRDAIDHLLELLEGLGISASWNLVGALFYQEYQGENGQKFPRLARPKYKWYHEDWLSKMPLGSVETDPLWYGRDIVEKIKSCHWPQEIGLHGFTHMLWGDPGFTVENARSELSHALQAAAEIGIRPRSFVFPDNQEAYHEVLAEFGFIAYRGRESESDEHPFLLEFSRPPKQLLAFTPRVWEPREKLPGLWNIPASMFLPHFSFPYNFIPARQRVKRASKGIMQAVNQKKIFHLWFHPFNMGHETGTYLSVLESILEIARKQIQAGNMANMTMSQIATEAASKKA
jgi:hypothetical protein